ncbi:MAG TPA: alanine dehydrogenase, partial [Chloroflexota bacterium]
GRNPQQLRAMDDLFQGQATTLFSTPYALESVLPTADVLVSGVYVSGARAPRLITREMVRSMPRGSVLVDVAIDQGGSAETSRPTTHADPVYQEEGVLHYCVTNMPAAYPATSTNALTNATLPYVLAIANRGLCQAVKADPALAKGVNCYRGHVTHPGVAAAWDLPHTPLERLLDC